MMIAERIQTLIHKLEVDGGARRLNYLALTLAVVALAVWYDTHNYRNFSSPEAMDAAQVARNLAEGKGFTTEFIRPFSVYLFQKHNRAVASGRKPLSTNAADFAQIEGRHPDLANRAGVSARAGGPDETAAARLEGGNCASHSGPKADGSCAISRNFSSPFSTRFCCWWSCC